MRADENPEIGLVAKNPDANYSAAFHFSSGGRASTQYISTTISLDAAMEHSALTDGRIAVIILGKLQAAEVIDLSDPRVAANLRKHQMTRNFAIKS